MFCFKLYFQKAAKKWENTCMIQPRNITLKIYDIFWFINYLCCWTFCTYILHKKIKQNSSGTRLVVFFILKLKITLFYMLSFAFICCTIPCHSLSPIVICYHSLSFVVTHCCLLSLVVIRCHSIYHSVSFVTTSCTIRYHSLSLVLPLIVTRCTTRLSFYKRSFYLMFLMDVL